MKKSEFDLISSFNHTLTSLTFVVESLTARVKEAEEALALANEKNEELYRKLRKVCLSVNESEEGKKNDNGKNN